MNASHKPTNNSIFDNNMSKDLLKESDHTLTKEQLTENAAACDGWQRYDLIFHPCHNESFKVAAEESNLLLHNFSQDKFSIAVSPRRA